MANSEGLLLTLAYAEFLTLAHAVQWHVERRVPLNGARTVVLH